MNVCFSLHIISGSQWFSGRNVSLALAWNFATIFTMARHTNPGVVPIVIHDHCIHKWYRQYTVPIYSQL